MIQTENMRMVALISPVSKTVGATATGTVDTDGYDHATILTILDTAATNPTALVLGEGTVTNSFTDLAEFIGDDGGGFTIPATDTDNPQVVRMEVDLIQVKRYLQLDVTAGATQVISAVAILSKGQTDQDIAGWGCSVMAQGNT